jgi:hypothetical protein
VILISPRSIGVWFRGLLAATAPGTIVAILIGYEETSGGHKPDGVAFAADAPSIQVGENQWPV